MASAPFQAVVEQRQSPRLVGLMPAELALDGRREGCTVEDLSAGGARVQCAARVALSAAAVLDVAVPGRGRIAEPARLVYRFAHVGGEATVYGLAFAQPLHLGAAAGGSAPGHVLVVHPRRAVGRRLVAALHAAGHLAVGVSSAAEADGWLAQAGATFYAALIEGAVAQANGGGLMVTLAAGHPHLRRFALVDPVYMPLAPGGARLPAAQPLAAPWTAAALGRALAGAAERSRKPFAQATRE